MSASIPPPGENTAIAAWYRTGKALDQVADLERRMLEEFARVNDRLRKAEHLARRSGHELDEWKENSEVRDLRKELAEANAIVKAREEAQRLWGRRVWSLVSAFVVLLAGAIVRELFRR